jgi:DNA-binding response OmpR family regulator
VPQRLLLVEDDDAIAAPLLRALGREGYEVERASLGSQALAIHAKGELDLVLLDLGLPDLDGIEVCRRIRHNDPDVVIVMLTARGDELDRVVGLDVGADDYLSKPFGLAELSARIRAALRRAGPPVPAPKPAVSLEPDADGFQIDGEARRVFVSGDEVQLSAKEFDLLAELAQDRGKALSREHLMHEVWDTNWFGSTKTLDATVARLRTKLEEACAPVTVTTIRGVGFRLDRVETDA